MKVFIVICLCSLFAMNAEAQETLFNVPNSKATDVGTNYLQVQGTTEFPTTNYNIVYDYGFAENFEAGISIYDISSAPGTDGGNSRDIVLNGQYFYNIEDDMVISWGAQVGHSEEDEWATYSFINLRREFFDDAFFVIGVFRANSAYLEWGSGFWHAGFEWPLIEHTLTFEAEYINGNSKISNGIVGLGYHVLTDTEITVGAQLPGFQSDNNWGVVAEITIH